MNTEAIAKIYASLIAKGLKTINQVPEPLRDAVQVLLNNDQVNIIFHWKGGKRYYGYDLCNSYHQG